MIRLHEHPSLRKIAPSDVRRVNSVKGEGGYFGLSLTNMTAWLILVSFNRFVFFFRFFLRFEQFGK